MLLYLTVAFGDYSVGYGGEAKLGKTAQGFGMGFTHPAVGIQLTVLEVEYEYIQPTGGCNLRVKLAQGACGGVARVGKQLQACRLTGAVQLLEYPLRHIYLASDTKVGQGLA